MGRAWARGWRVGVVQVIKGGQWNTGEQKLGEHLGVDWWCLGDASPGVDRPRARPRRRAAAWQVAREKLASGDYDLLILDELTYAITFGWVPVDDVVAGIRDRAPHTNVIVTGRDAPAELIELADTVSDVRMVKHAFDQGVSARRGLEY
jgi:cob(I)alamin adenosyltransferase